MVLSNQADENPTYEINKNPKGFLSDLSCSPYQTLDR